MHPIKKVLIVAKQNKKGIRLGKKLEEKMKEYIDDVCLEPTTALRLRKKGVQIKKFDGDVIITIGGDGTFLRASSQTNIPILPVKIEGHGFLCTTTFKRLMEQLEAFLEGKYSYMQRSRLQCTKVKSGKIEKYIGKLLHKKYPLSVNEIVFARKRPSKILEMDFKIDDVVFDFRGDGLMFSTPAGSTGYSVSAGGPVVDPSVEVINVVPLYPFYSKLKPMVIPDTKVIEVNVKEGDCSVIIDGHGGEYIKNETTFLIEKAEPIKIIKLGEQNFYKRLKKEFF